VKLESNQARRGYDIHVSKPYSVLGLMYVLSPVSMTRNHPSGSGFNRNQNIKTYVNENIQLKIDLLQEQIDNLEKSGFY
jgi:hypothetical protein